MDNKIKSLFNKMKPNKRYLPLFGLHSKYLLIILFLTLFMKSKEQNVIKVVVNGNGLQTFLVGGPIPSKIEVSGNTCNNQKTCSCNQDSNNEAVITFSGSVNDCEKMFYGLTNIIEIDLSNFDMSSVATMQMMFSLCRNLKKIIFGNTYTTSLTNLYQTFGHCFSLLSLDLSHFVTSSVTTMCELFTNCHSLTSLNVSTFKTENVENMYDMFGYCFNVTSLDVSNFETSKVKDMQGMFYSCYKLKHLDITNFDVSQTTRVISMFGHGDSLLYINMSTFKISSSVEHIKVYENHLDDLKVCLIDLATERLLVDQINNFNFDCSDNCFPKTYKYDLYENICLEFCGLSLRNHFDYNDICYYRCPNTTYEPNDKEYFCFDKIPGDSYYYNTVREVFKKCHTRCKICYQKGDDTNTKCIECKDNYIFLNESDPNTLNNCYDKCTYYYYFNEHNTYTCTNIEKCPTNYGKLIQEKKKCIDECKNDNYYKYEYNNICYLQCPNGTNETEDHICTEITENIPSTALKTTEFPSTALKTTEVPSTEKNIIYQSEATSDVTINCFHSCKSCFDQGDEINHNCKECKEGFIFLNEFITKKNCYNKCPFYYYFNELNQYLCTSNGICPNQYPKFIPIYKKCIDECKKDRIYKYEYNNVCYEHCQDGTIENEDYICKKEESDENIPYNCSDNDPLITVCSIKDTNNNTEIYNIIKN